MNIGPKTRTYTIEPLQVPIPRAPEDEEKESEPQRPQQAGKQPAPPAAQR